MAEYYSAEPDHIELIQKLGIEVQRWRSAWQPESGKPPELKVCRYRKWYILVDSRGLPGTEKVHVLTPRGCSPPPNSEALYRK